VPTPMTHLHSWKNLFTHGLLWVALFAGTPSALAQGATAPQAGSTFSLPANTADGARFDLSAIGGNVTVVFYWSTGCAVCRDSLPELRANLAGWRNKPFSLVVVNVDRQAQDWLAYERVLGKMQVPQRGYISVRQDDSVVPPIRLPMTLVVDAKGKVVQRIDGRVAPEVWDTVADLLN